MGGIINEATEPTASVEISSDSEPPEILSDTDSVDSDYVDVSALRQRFLEDYDRMKDANKWIIACSGRSVEGVMQKKAREMAPEIFSASLTRFWILDLACPVTKSWFSKDEWSEITKEGPTGKADSGFLRYLSSFRKAETLDDLRRMLFEPLPSSATKLQRDDKEWIHLALLSFLRLRENPSHLLTQTHKEDWYSTNVWGPFVDNCLLTLPGLTTERKELSCHAVQNRKNSTRTFAATKSANKARLKPGPRFNGVTRTVSDTPLEYVLFECSPTYHNASHSSKDLSDSRKLFTAMREMLGALSAHSKNSPTVLPLLKVAGVVTAGLHLQVHRMARPKGHVYLLQKEKVRHVPTSVEEFEELLLLMNAVRAVKRDVEGCMELVKKRGKGRSDDEFLKEAAGERDATPESTFFPAHETP